jgi:hypothetical protein
MHGLDRFYSCNGWDADANADDFAGPVLWKDVMNSQSLRRQEILNQALTI